MKNIMKKLANTLIPNKKSNKMGLRVTGAAVSVALILAIGGTVLPIAATVATIAAMYYATSIATRGVEEFGKKDKVSQPEKLDASKSQELSADIDNKKTNTYSKKATKQASVNNEAEAGMDR